MYLFFILGGLILTFGIILLIIRIQYIRNGIITEATIEDLYIEKSMSSEDSEKFYVKFRYYTLNNEEIIYETDDLSTNSDWQIGDIVTIVYQTYNPRHVVFLDFVGSFGLVAVLISAALVLILIGAGYYWMQHFLNNL